MPSSRTPEGIPSRCPMCGIVTRIDPSATTNDAPCPCCGHLLWIEPAMPKRPAKLLAIADRMPSGRHARIDVHRTLVFTGKIWFTSGAVTAILVGMLDQSFLHAIGYLAANIVVGLLILPIAARQVQKPSQFLRDVALGWAFVPGPVIGQIGGALSQPILDLPISALVAALVGMVVGPVFAAIEGWIVGSLVAICYRLLKGEWLSFRDG